MKHLIIICLLIFNLSSLAIASNNINAHIVEQDIAMVYESLQELFPLVLNEQEFNHLNNKNTIGKNITALTNLFEDIKKHSQKDPITFKITYEALSRHLNGTKKSFNDNNMIYTRYLLKSLPSICIFCRKNYLSTESSYGKEHKITVNKDLFKSDFELAEYYYILTNYPLALKNYEAFIANKYNSKENVAQNLQTSLERILTIYLQYNKDPKTALNVLQEYQQKFIFPEYIKIYINEWIKGLEVTEQTFAERKDIKKSLTFRELKKQINKYFNDQEIIPPSFIIPKSDQPFFLMLYGYLYDYLSNNNTKLNEAPTLLYWLSLCDRALDYHSNISIADLFLKECVTANPKDPYAKKCLSEYTEYVTLPYINDQIPASISKEIYSLHTLVYNAK